jgi:hypothetical protein
MQATGSSIFFKQHATLQLSHQGLEGFYIIMHEHWYSCTQCKMSQCKQLDHTGRKTCQWVWLRDGPMLIWPFKRPGGLSIPTAPGNSSLLYPRGPQMLLLRENIVVLACSSLRIRTSSSEVFDNFEHSDCTGNHDGTWPSLDGVKPPSHSVRWFYSRQTPSHLCSLSLKTTTWFCLFTNRRWMLPELKACSISQHSKIPFSILPQAIFAGKPSIICIINYAGSVSFLVQ